MLVLKTFGGLSLVAPDASVPSGPATQRRRLALLAVLAASAEAGVTREKLLALFWPDTEEARARAALAQALYALKQGLGVEEVVLGSTTLRLNEAALTSDVGRFRKAVAGRRWAEAAEQWTGPFLDGVVVPGLDEFERWVEVERGVLRREAVEVFEHLAREAASAGDRAGAVRWWHRRVAADPHSATGAVGLMEALAAAGDRAAALVHARVYETLVSEQLELPPDPAVLAAAARLRTEQPVVPLPGPAPAGRSDPPLVPAPLATYATPEARSGDAASLSPARPSRRGPTRSRWLAGAAVVAGLGAVGGYLAHRAGTSSAPWPAGAQVVAVGAFAAVGEEVAPAARALTDMLATNLAQAPGLNVLSSTRLYELAAGARGDTAQVLMAAARAAGATDLVEGSAYQVAGGVRLDLRRTSLGTGKVMQAVTVTAPDLFAAVDSGTARLLEGLGGRASLRPLAEVHTSSLMAYRLYEEGLRALSAGQGAAANRFFSAALEEDSTFAMAAYYQAQSIGGVGAQYFASLARAVRLAEHAGERERLLILWTWADQQDDPSRSALADTLVARYASEPFAHLHYARAMLAAGRFPEALAALRRAIALDRVGRSAGATGRCIRCEATGELSGLLRGLDSLRAAERVAREFVRFDRSAGAYHTLAEALMAQGRLDEALEALDRAGELSPGYDVPLNRATMSIREGRFDLANAELERRIRSTVAAERNHAGWWLQFARRAQGRLGDAMEVARALRASDSTWGQRGAAPYLATVMAAVLFEQGRHREAAALWDSIVVLRAPGLLPSRQARHEAWFLTLAATAHAAAGDTAGLGARADRIEALGRQSAYIRDQRLHHHVRGLLDQARGRHAEAVQAFRAAGHMPAVDYGRNRQALARSLAALGRHDEALAALRPLLAGPLDGSNSYLPLTEVREQMAELFALAGRFDSAAVYGTRVADAWRAADPRFEARRRRMEDLGVR